MGAYDKINFNGVTLNRRTAAMLQEAERRLGYKLTLFQGSYNKSVGASAGTHDGGGAVDLAPADAARKVRVLRDIGFAAWHRRALPGVWVEHIHAVAIGDRQLSPMAAAQVVDYRNHRDGLAGHGPDNTYHPSPIPTFNYYRWLRRQRTDDRRHKYDSGDVYIHKLKKGVRNSDSVSRLQTRLKKLNRIRTLFLRVNGDYGPKTVKAVRRYQKRYAKTGPNDGTFLSAGQANHLFGPNYNVHP